MTVGGEIVLENVYAAVGGICEDNTLKVSPEAVAATGFPVRRVSAEPLFELAMGPARAARENASSRGMEIGAVVAATFSCEKRFPPLSVRIASALGLPRGIPALDIQMACSAYPYAVYTAGRLASDIGKPVLVVDGDVQSRLVADGDGGNAAVMGDAASATVVSFSGGGVPSAFAFYSDHDEALDCGESGPVKMDGFGVFSFVATKVKPLLADFTGNCGEFDFFVPHQANMYMLRQLAKGLGLESKMLTSGEKYGNVGSASIPLTVAVAAGLRDIAGSRLLLAGFGAGFSAAVGTVALSPDFEAGVAD